MTTIYKAFYIKYVLFSFEMIPPFLAKGALLGSDAPMLPIFSVPGLTLELGTAQLILLYIVHPCR